MKSFILPFLLFSLLFPALKAQKIGMNIINPLHPVHISQAAGFTLLDNQPLIFAEYTGTNAANVIGLKAISKPFDGFGVGGEFEGGSIGLTGKVSGIGEENNYYGLLGQASGTGTGYFHGMYGLATGAGTNVGLLGHASGGATNWAGFFAGGNVYIQNKLGIGTAVPGTSLHVTQGNLSLQEYNPIVKIEYTGNAISSHLYGLEVNCEPAPGYGIGGIFSGGTTGLFATASSISSSINSGVYGAASASSNANYGVYGWAGNEGTLNVGIYGYADPGPQSYSGYFSGSKVYVQTTFAIGESQPNYAFEMTKTGATGRFTSTNYTNGSSLILKNTTPSSTFLGSLIFDNSTGNIPGGIYYSTDHHMSFVVNGVSRLLLNPSGLMGVGRTPVTNRLEVEGNASKSSAGDWLANSDARLKKNIEPLNPEEMIQKLLELKGIRYEWDDDKTGTTRPAGVQYGFTAQNIQKVFPELVEEDRNGYLQTAYSTYDPMLIEAIRYLAEEVNTLKKELHKSRERVRNVTLRKAQGMKKQKSV